MSTQVTVRLDDDNVKFVDALVAAGRVRSRAEAVDRALRHERRREDALRDAAIYADTEPDPDMQALAGYVGQHPPALQD